MIARLTEQAIVENINRTILVEESTISGKASMNFKKTLETVVDNVVDMVKNGLQQNHHLSKILIEIKAGQKSCHCVQDFLIPEAQIYLEQYPIFIDVVIKVSRHPSLPPTPSTPPPPKAFSTESMNASDQTAQPQAEAESTTEILVFVEHDYMCSTSTTDLEDSTDTNKKGNAKETIKQQKLKRVNSFGVIDCADFTSSS
ncbi:hypothetical protein BKA69DRAFT_790823 [Paraphysoderma sedebokerense]|nr:hypothetical protein BKA69DRAFT_790823 [Paraphysoderma sedebokerense]